jgi:hypothetical protein
MSIIEEFKAAINNKLIEYQNKKGGLLALSEKRKHTIAKISEIVNKHCDSVLLRRELMEYIQIMNGNVMKTFSFLDRSKLRLAIEEVLNLNEFSEDSLTIQERLELRNIHKKLASQPETENLQMRFDRLKSLLDIQQQNIQIITEKNKTYEKSNNEMTVLYAELVVAKTGVDTQLRDLQEKFNKIAAADFGKRVLELEQKMKEQEEYIQRLILREQDLLKTNKDWAEKYQTLEKDYQKLVANNKFNQEEVVRLKNELGLAKDGKDLDPAPQLAKMGNPFM